MKVLIAYYGRTGNNGKLVNELQAKLGCDVEKIVDTVNRKGVWGFLKGGMQVYRKKMSRIEPIEKDPSSHDFGNCLSTVVKSHASADQNIHLRE